MSANKVVIGNWKMHGSPADLWDLANAVQRDGLPCDAAICVPFPLLPAAHAALLASPLRWGAQDCSVHAGGAHTGEVSAELIARLGARYVIVGHSERRSGLGESDAVVAEKAHRVLAAGMTPVVCIGETSAERDANETAAVLRRQLAPLVRVLGRALSAVVLAYEPVWSIGSGDCAAPGVIADTLGLIERTLHFQAGMHQGAMRVLYGGSVNPRNATAIMACPGVDGVLVGGASLQPADFLDICRAAKRMANDREMVLIQGS